MMENSVLSYEEFLSFCMNFTWKQVDKKEFSPFLMVCFNKEENNILAFGMHYESVEERDWKKEKAKNYIKEVEKTENVTALYSCYVSEVVHLRGNDIDDHMLDEYGENGIMIASEGKDRYTLQVYTDGDLRVIENENSEFLSYPKEAFLGYISPIIQ